MALIKGFIQTLRIFVTLLVTRSCAQCAWLRAQVKLLLSEVLLPALCMVPSNVGLVNDVWGVLHYLDYHERWAIYNAHKVGLLLNRHGTGDL